MFYEGDVTLFIYLFSVAYFIIFEGIRFRRLEKMNILLVVVY